MEVHSAFIGLLPGQPIQPIQVSSLIGSDSKTFESLDIIRLLSVGIMMVKVFPDVFAMATCLGIGCFLILFLSGGAPGSIFVL